MREIILSFITLLMLNLSSPTNAQDSLLQKSRVIDINGQSIEFPSTSGLNTVLVFLSPECPLSQNYTRTLNELNGEFQNEVKFIGIIPGRAYSLAEINTFIKEYKIGFIIVGDTARQISAHYTATVTPEVLVLDKKGKIRYRGAIDNWAFALGKTRTVATRFYLRDALFSLTHGQMVVQEVTRPVGCLINDY